MIRKTIISAFLSAVILFSGAFAPVAQASVVDDVIVAYSEASWAQAMMSGILSTSGAMFLSPLAGIAGGVAAEGINNLAEWYAAGHTDQEVYDAFNDHAAALETDLGSTSIADGSIFYKFPVASMGGTYVEVSESSGVGTSSFYLLFKWKSGGSSHYGTVSLDKIVAPVAGVYSTGFYGSVSNCALRSNTNFREGVSVSAGGEITCIASNGSLRFEPIVNSEFCTASGFAWCALTPAAGIGSLTQVDITPISRPSSFVGPVGVRNEDNSYTVYNQTIVNETDNTIFNPVTNITTVFTDWAFDYSTRTYTLTLEDGSTVTVIYGDDCMTIIQSDQEYTVYYVLPHEEDPGADPDAPGTDDGSGWAWLKGAWTEMMDKLSDILKAITGLELSPEINVDVDVDVEGEEQETQESWFSKLLTKFSFLTSVHDIYSQLIADVTSDAATAAAVADGEVMLADVTNGHASVYAADRHGFYTAPELAISFGSSDKYGVDWANIRPLDLSWYAPYKDTVDGILSGILWLSYLFLLIKRAPGIIRGAEMVTEDRIKIDDWRIRH